MHERSASSGERQSMSERPVELQAILNEVRRRWTRRSRLHAWAIGAAAATTGLLAGLGAVWLMAPDGIRLVVIVSIVLLLCAGVIGRVLWGFRYSPTNRQIARFIEERESGLDDVVVTAVDYAARPDASARTRDALLTDAARA